MKADDKIGSYQLLECVLFKTMYQGEVWLAKKEDAAGLVEMYALKFIPTSILGLGEKELQELKDEARLWHSASKGNHENIVRYVETIEYETPDDDKYFVVVSEYATGGSLQQLIEDRKNKNAPFTSQEIKSILGGVLSGLEHVHSKQIFHRDLKPANIVFNGETPKIIDFGISRLYNPNHSQVARGTPYFMAPEAFDGERDVAVDTWSVGVMFYYMVVGKLPFAPASGDWGIIRRAVNREDYTRFPENIPVEYQTFIDKALDKVPAKRFESAAEMRAAIESLPALPTDPHELKTTERDLSKIPVESVLNVDPSGISQLTLTEKAQKEENRIEEPELPELSETTDRVNEVDEPKPIRISTERLMQQQPVVLMGAAAVVILLIAGIAYAVWKLGQPPHEPVVVVKPTIKIKLATSWKNLPILSESVAKMAKEIQDASKGEVEIQILQAGEAKDKADGPIEPLKLFDAVARGDIQMAHTAPYYHEHIPGAVFFSSVPFGMDAGEMKYWLNHKDGIKLWRELYGERGVVPFACGNTGQQYGGWFSEPINYIEDFQGLRMRIPGLGGKVLALLGAEPKKLAASEIIAAKRRDEIDAAEWIGPYHDHALELYNVFRYYYEQGWQEPNTMFELIINKAVYDQFSDQLKTIIATKTQEYNDSILVEFDGKNAEYRRILEREKGVRIRRFSALIIDNLRQATKTVLDEHVKDNDKSKVIYESYKKTQQEFRNKQQRVS